jgi:adenine-specific DNA-methyltransferase
LSNRLSDEFIFCEGLSVSNRDAENFFIRGENLKVLTILARDFKSRVKCVYIDPPYNSGNSFAHYDDAVDSGEWLKFMEPRLRILHELLASDGVLFVSIDDDEMAYLKVLLDQIFGRRNFCGTLVWEKKKKPSFLSKMGSVTEYVLAYAKEKTKAPDFIYGRTTLNKKYPFNNAGNGLRTLSFPAGRVEFGLSDQDISPCDMSEGNITTKLLDKVAVRGGRNVAAFRLEGEWRYSQKTLDDIALSGDRIVISKLPFRPNHERPGGLPKKMRNLLSADSYGLPTYEDAAAESRRLFGEDAFSYPKPEELISVLIEAVTKPGELVLDAFVGSGTTAAVAHKLKRRWIGIEQGEHLLTHCVPRLRKVVSGTDPGGITESSNWRGGGGFAVFDLR